MFIALTIAGGANAQGDDGNTNATEPQTTPALTPEKPAAPIVDTAPLPAPQQSLRFEGVGALSATSPASNVETIVTTWIGARGGTLAPSKEGSAVGFDVGAFASTATEGTPEVSATRTLAYLEGRGLYAPLRVTSTYSAITPYGFLGASLGGGLVSLAAFEDARFRFIGTWATRAGVGAELQLHALTTRLELGAGLRDLRFELTSALTLGVAL